MTLHRCFAASVLVLLAAGAMPSRAQDYDRPPGGGYQDDRGDGGDARGAPEPSDDAGLAVRVSRAEARIREMTGQIEELQNDNRKLVEQLQKFQQDVDSRPASGSRGKRAEAAPPPDADVPATAAGATPPKPERKGRRDEAYDPDAGGGGNPGDPKPLGSVASAQPDDTGAPMDLSGGRLRRSETNSDTLAPTLKLPSTSARPSGGTVTPDGTVVASTAPTSPRAAFDTALGFYKDKQYEDAEKGFAAFIQKNPKSRLAADATYYLGESYTQRGRSREAAEQYLKVSTDYSSSSRAPDAMLHLGMSLKALGAKEQACATFTEVSRKYPNAPAYVKAGADREAKRAQC